jgi:signal transduction histidine kinase/CheY-like chemotaxis protein
MSAAFSAIMMIGALVLPELKDMIARAAAGEFVRWDAEIYGRAGGKETITIDASLMPVKDETGKVVFIAAEGRDITEKKAYEREIARQREELAKLDVLKTQFFANISHEFRTPLTLMLGPLDEMKREFGRSGSSLSILEYQKLDLVHRNGLRLLKLVNTLLDFSRIEAGRVQAIYELTDLAQLTAHLASEFRSAVEKAGLTLSVNCQPLPEKAFVDREMWEKIVLNLLSNACKFTFAGGIEISLEHCKEGFELVVRDTGTGIPGDELPRIFERFHRVAGARGRTYEGSGIGLALVQELARLHGGTVEVESVYGRGSTFRVRIPAGSAHLPQQQIGGVRSQTSTALGALPFVEEALRWLPGQEPARAVVVDDLTSADQSVQTEADRPLVLLADDNADMREYLSRLLTAHYRVEAVADGEAALQAIARHMPDLVLSDVMMPRLDGMQLLARLRANVATSTLPVILLSARAGEEAKVEGLDAGADDYLVKPFSAREMLARIDAHLKIARARGEVTDTIRENEERYRAFVAASSDVVFRMSPDWSEMRFLQGKDFIADTENPSQGWLQKYIHPDNHAEVLAAIREAIRTKSPFELEHPVIRVDGSLGWTHSRAIPMFGSQGQILEWFGAARDISERKKHEETQMLLVSELSHRVKNTLAVVQAIAQQTLRNARDPAEFAASFGGRIQSMSRMHGLLSETGWQGAELREIIDGHLIVTDPSRIMKSGPPVQLDPQVALHVALMLHELGTNSVKYGALSKPGGIVKLDWSVNVGKLELHWAESGGPPVKAPLKRGFGTILIEQTVRGEGGHSEMQIEAEGLRWDITIPIQSEK